MRERTKVASAGGGGDCGSDMMYHAQINKVTDFHKLIFGETLSRINEFCRADLRFLETEPSPHFVWSRGIGTQAAARNDYSVCTVLVIDVC
jgi:hypothetical protein